MWNSYVSTGTDCGILILALDSGSGHRIRMERLKRHLNEKRMPCHLRMIPYDENHTQQIIASEPVGLLILDARDMDPGLHPDIPVIAIDNMHPRRKSSGGGILFYDTLPHPELDDRFDEILRQILFDADVTERIIRWRRPALPGSTRVTFYAGPEGFMNPSTIDEIDASMRENDSVLYTRIGGRAGGMTSIAYLSRLRYLDLLLDSDIILTYPGMTFWEGLVLGACPVLIETGSPVHDSLSEYLARRTGVLYLRDAERKQMTTVGMILDAMTRPLSVDLSAWRKDVMEHPGLLRLVRMIEELWNDSGKRAFRN